MTARLPPRPLRGPDVLTLHVDTVPQEMHEEGVGVIHMAGARNEECMFTTDTGREGWIRSGFINIYVYIHIYLHWIKNVKGVLLKNNLFLWCSAETHCLLFACLPMSEFSLSQ